MKKLIFIILALSFICLFVLSSCDSTDNNPPIDSNQQAVEGTSDDSDATDAPIDCQHTFGEWNTVKEATCKEEGKRVRYCSICAEAEEEVISKSETHAIVADIAVSATCKDTGLTEGSHCSVCNKVLVAQTVIPKTEDHTPITDAAIAASCKNTGLTEGSHCSVCNKVLVAQTVVPKKPHTYGSWQVLIEPTETKEGLRHKVCTACTYEITEDIPSINESAPSEQNVILFELRNNEYWVTGVQNCTDPILIIPSTYQGKPVVGISEKSFYKNTVLEEVVIPESVKTYEYRAFYKCTSLKRVVLPDGIKDIPSDMFFGCGQLAEINLPDSIQSIGTEAFYSCTKLNLGSITLKCTLGNKCFSGVSFDTLTIDNAVLSNGLAGAKINKLILAEGLKTIEEDALQWTKIEEILFPTSLTTIENSAFYGVGVEKIVLNSPVYLKYGAFNNCKMKEIVIVKGSTFDKCVFMNCDNLETVYYGGTREEWRLLIANYGYSNEDYQFIGKLHVVCSDDQ